MPHRPGASTALVLALSAALVVSVACNRIDSSAGGASPAAVDATNDSDDAQPAPAGPPPGSNLSSLGPGVETRIYYQYVDERGSVRFAERLADVPESWRDKVGYLELDSPPPMSPGDAKRMRDERYGRSNPSSTSLASAGDSSGRAMDRFEPTVLLYGADWCGACRMAKRHLERAGVDFEMRDVDNPHNASEMVEKTGQRGIPVIEVDGRIMKGYNAQALDELLDS